eukprot:TRINITY_DN6858_c0_g1_i2.p1 TRINITY_DN6858_c0_g1~~TRINITY_DN6858_c0_g1_i2.p1  ORF type:complete len:351 (+),score=76.08 TRINITY_DN6858_c0_g1_i2:62-1114(+)
MLPGLVQQSPGVSQDYVQAAATGGMLPMPSPQVAPHAAALPVLPRGVASPADESLSVALLMQQVEAFRAQLAQFTDALQDQRQALMFEAQERRELAELLCSERNEREQAIQSVMDSLQAERDQLTAGIRQLRRELQLECDIRAEEARQLNASICASRGDKSASSCTQLGVAGCAGDTSAFPKATSGGIPTPAELSLATAPGTAPVAAGVALDSAACAQPDVSGSRHDMEDRYLASAEAAQAGVHQGALAPEAASAVSARAQHECLRRVMQQPQQPQQPQQHVQQVKASAFALLRRPHLLLQRTAVTAAPCLCPRCRTPPGVLLVLPLLSDRPRLRQTRHVPALVICRGEF